MIVQLYLDVFLEGKIIWIGDFINYHLINKTTLVVDIISKNYKNFQNFNNFIIKKQIK
jgi:hypothetical protein